VARRLAGPVKHGRDRLVGHLAREGANQVDHLGVRGPTRLAGAVALHRQAAVVAPLPVDDQVQVVADNVDDDLVDHRADDPLARLRRRARTLPCPGQVLAEGHEPLAIRRRENQLAAVLQLVDLELETPHRGQAFVPPPLQFANHQAVLRVGGVVLALRPGRLVAGLLQGKLELTSLLGAALAARLDRPNAASTPRG
jgi:hypothetical protein